MDTIFKVTIKPEKLLREEQPETSVIVTSEGNFNGEFCRTETYER